MWSLHSVIFMVIDELHYEIDRYLINIIITIIITNNRIINTTEPRMLPIVITEDFIVVELTVLEKKWNYEKKSK